MLAQIIELVATFFNKANAESSVDKEHVESYEAEVKSPDKIREKISVSYKAESKERLEKEHKNLKSKNEELYKLIENANDYCNKEFAKGLVVTMIHRTQAEQDYLYRNSEKYKIKKFKSPHQFWQAVDIRSKTFSQDEIDKLVKFLNEKYNNKNYWKWTAKCHEVGSNGRHFHVQFLKS